MSEQLEGRCLVHKNCDVAHTVPQVLQIADLRAENDRLQERVEEAKALGPDFGALLRAAHKEQYRRTIIDYPPVDPNGQCHSLCRHVFLIKSALARILEENDG